MKDWKRHLKGAGRKSIAAGNLVEGRVHALLEKRWPEIEQLIYDRAGPAAMKAIKDDEKMRTVFGMVYDSLPLSLHRLMSEEKFVNYCLDRRSALVRYQQTENGE
jgi:hypothetical protein